MGLMRLFALRYSQARALVVDVNWTKARNARSEELIKAHYKQIIEANYMAQVLDAIVREMEQKTKYLKKDVGTLNLEDIRLETLDAWVAREVRSGGNMRFWLELRKIEDTEEETKQWPVLENLSECAVMFVLRHCIDMQQRSLTTTCNKIQP